MLSPDVEPHSPEPVNDRKRKSECSQDAPDAKRPRGDDKCYVIYDAGCTMVRGIYLTRDEAYNAIETAVQAGLYSPEDVYLHGVPFNTPLEIGVDSEYLIE